jgi:hypothetical protein
LYNFKILIFNELNKSSNFYLAIYWK